MTVSRLLSRDALASVVVFLVALPLCMGIAIASGMPPAKGLITGIIGGLIVGFLSGSPLQVSGPAAGLAVLVFELVRTHGMAALGPVLLLAGLVQLLAGMLRLGGWFRVTAPAVVSGMLAGIGILIVLSQLHVMIDSSPLASGLDNLLAFPGALMDAFSQANGGSASAAGVTGIGTIVCMWLWDRHRPKALNFLPGALVGVTLATLASMWLALPIKRVELPTNLSHAIDWTTPHSLSTLADPQLLIAALAIAFIASAETLLSAAAVDRMHTGPRSQFNRELSAQGVGNMLCGALGALPMTGVIVRSSANVQAGARGRTSTILHGLWLLALVSLFPEILQNIPIASLGGVLVYTGFKLVDPKAIRNLAQYGRIPPLIYIITALSIVLTDLLTGVLTGFVLTLLKLLWSASRLRITLATTGPGQAKLHLHGAATFLRVPQLAKALADIEPGTHLRVCMDRLSYIDHACMELLEDWGRSARTQGGELEIAIDEPLKHRVEGRQRTVLV
ncbi:SulP family inorganic anion transporter [Halomonas elongata]|uniref:SulP family inorganic anion transporter n=1 Tax=Halomonas elongata TaxID=2746 RepID=UPI003360BF0A